MDRLYPILWLRVIPWGNLALTQFECFINLSSSGICADDLISLQIRTNSCMVLVYRIKTKIYYDIQVSVLYGVGGCVKCRFFCGQIYSKILTSTSPIRLHWESIYTPVNDHRRAAAIWAIARRRWVKVLAADRLRIHRSHVCRKAKQTLSPMRGLISFVLTQSSIYNKNWFVFPRLLQWDQCWHFTHNSIHRLLAQDINCS